MDLITTHLNADFDGLASMVAAGKLYPGAKLVLPAGAQVVVRSFMAQHDVGVTRLRGIDLDQVTRLILVDTQDPSRIGPLKQLCENPGVAIHVYDHHPSIDRSSQDVPPLRADLRVVEPVGATTTILVERLHQKGVKLNPFEATVLALGIYEETGSLAYVSTTARDLHAAATLVQAGADLTVVSNTLRRHMDPHQVALLNDLLLSGETYYLDGYKVLLATSAYDRYRGDFADVVHQLAEMEGYDAVVAAIAMEEKVEIIGRSRKAGLDIGKLVKEFGGGGHATAGAASVKGLTLLEVRSRLTELLTERHRPALLARDVMTKPVKSVRDQATVSETESLMTRYGVNTFPVLDAKERYQGLISRETVQKALFHKFAKSPIKDFIQTDRYTASADTPYHEIESRMIELNQRFVPILDGLKVIGVITRTDLLRALHDDVIAAARAHTKGEGPLPSPSRRNVRGSMKERLPKRVFAELEQAGELADHMGVSAFVVGGFVRDLLLGIENLDLDLVIEGDGIAFARALGRREGARVKVHERFGTAVVIFPDRFKLDVATARTEYYEYPTALPSVEQSSIKKDLYRRDFTINTLAISLNTHKFGDLIDFYGGQRDLKEKTIRVLHSLSFVEDPTRVFRAVRFVQRFGFHLGKETLALIKGAVKMDLFHRLSGHRLLDELIHLFSEDEPPKIVTRLAELDLLRFIHPSLAKSTRLAMLVKAVDETLGWYKLLYLDRKVEQWLVYFMALMDVMAAKAAGEALKRLAVPARYAEKIKTAHIQSNDILRQLAKRPPPRPAETYHLLEGHPDETLLLLMAKTKLEPVKRQLSAYLTTCQHIKPSLTGADLKAMGLKPGPQFKKILEQLRDARLDGDVKTEAEERELVKRIANL